MRQPLAAAGVRVHAERLVEVADTAALLGYERTAHIDLVVICAHRHARLLSLAPSALAERLRCQSAVPVLHVPASGDSAASTPELAPLDGSARADDRLDVAPVPPAAQIRALRKPS
jgi:hypothetical protein